MPLKNFPSFCRHAGYSHGAGGWRSTNFRSQTLLCVLRECGAAGGVLGKVPPGFVPPGSAGTLRVRGPGHSTPGSLERLLTGMCRGIRGEASGSPGCDQSIRK